ncbi:hypothetical protein HSBAA_08960 [Vreelandella sulfidaeris]|uniref:GTPase Der C-terminal KH-domain-like domain-containing protein n=1 Tax=Vreelandella sulfidaeris TaxID=115553 RepID=A0A455U0W1_9GAMM|nr:hypothetical protein HSBAA_08960 [Halomonas sulfidaeris]
MAHQGGSNPPIIVVHGNQTEALPEAYRRYLTNTFRKVLKVRGTPIRFEFRSGSNPFDNMAGASDKEKAKSASLTAPKRRARAVAKPHITSSSFTPVCNVRRAFL